MVVRSEEMQAAIVRGEAVNDEELTRHANAVTRILNALRRKSKQPHAAAPNLQDYLATKRADAAA